MNPAVSLASLLVVSLTFACTDQPTVPDVSPQFAVGGEPGSPPDRITYGEAEAVLNAFLPAGFLIVLREGFVEVPAAPGDFFGSKGAIRPLPSFNGLRYCTLDWVVPVLGIFASTPAFEWPQGIREQLERTSLAFWLDGQPFATRRTPLKPVNHLVVLFDVQRAFGFQQGELVAPGTLSVGAHTLRADIFFDGEPVDSPPEITFFIDPAESATCTG
jgi:hypothetical protein